MVGPSGMDKPAEPTPPTFNAAARAFLALARGDKTHAAALAAALGEVEFAQLRLLARRFDDLATDEYERRQHAEAPGQLTLVDEP
jgi:hypothetical protein